MTCRRLPIYILLDCSASMWGEPIQALCMGVKSFIADLKTNPQASETAWISIIVFAGDAWQSVPLTELSSFPAIFPILDSADESALGAALVVLKRAIDHEVARRTVDDLGDYRPLVVVLIDGMPSDDWESPARLLLRRRTLGGMLICGAGLQVPSAELAASVPGIVGLDMKDIQPNFVMSFLKWLDQNPSD